MALREDEAVPRMILGFVATNLENLAASPLIAPSVVVLRFSVLCSCLIKL